MDASTAIQEKIANLWMSTLPVANGFKPGLERSSTTHLLPADVLQRVLLVLRCPFDIFSCSQVCRSWNSHFQNDEFWRLLYEQRWGEGSLRGDKVQRLRIGAAPPKDPWPPGPVFEGMSWKTDYARRFLGEKHLLLRCLKLLEHACSCKKSPSQCSYGGCMSLKMLLQHVKRCRTGESKGCAHCKKMHVLLQWHACFCANDNCGAPRCPEYRQEFSACEGGQCKKKPMSLDPEEWGVFG